MRDRVRNLRRLQVALQLEDIVANALRSRGVGALRFPNKDVQLAGSLGKYVVIVR
jgi:hypothetical protein